MILIFRPKGSKAEIPKPFTASRDVAGGPGGLDGTIYALPTGKCGYYPDAQEWTESGGLWWGKDDTPVEPEMLKTDEQIDGHLVTLEYGHKWLIPTVRVFPAGTRLPEALVLGPGGELVSKALPRFAQVSSDGERVYRSLVEGDGELEWADGWTIANRLLAINYHVTPEYVSAACLLTTANILEVLRAMVDVPTIMAELKKKATNQSDTDSSSAGNAA